MVFPVLHGTFGEDGTVQGLLELADLPYVGAGVLASSVSMDKEMMKRVCRERDLPVVEYVTVYREQIDTDAGLRPAAIPGVRQARQPGIVGGDFEGAQRPGAGSGPGAGGAIRPQDHRGARHRRAASSNAPCWATRHPWRRCRARSCPPRNSTITKTSTCWTRPAPRCPRTCRPRPPRELRRLAVECYRAVECEGMARVDFLLESATGKLYLNEINTIPGFTSISMYPKMWEHSGIGFSALIDRLIELALSRHERKKATRFAR